MRYWRCSGVALPMLAGLATLLGAAPATAQPLGDALAGQDLAGQLCAACHALTPGAASPNPAAPNFNTMTLPYPPEYLAEGFAEGIVVGTQAHIGMPEFELAPEQIDDLIAYLETVLPPAITPERE